MARHEAICFKNPRRVCLECGVVHPDGNQDQTNVVPLVELLETSTVSEVQLKADGCPACTLAAVLQYNSKHDLTGEESVQYDYKSALDDYRAAKLEHDAMYET